MLTPTPASSSTVNRALWPNSVMLARIGTSTASRMAWNSLRSFIASGKIASAPASTSALARSCAASSPSVARMSVRAMIRKFGSRRASAAARMRLVAVSRSTTFLPSRWPQRLGLNWSSMWQPARPAFSSSWTRAGHVHGLAEAGVGVDDRRQVRHPGDLPGPGGHLGEGGQPDVRQAEVVGQDGAGDVDPGEALLLDQPGRERVERARELLRWCRRRGARGSRIRFCSGVAFEYSIRRVPSARRRGRSRRRRPGCSAGPARRRRARGGARRRRGSARSPRRPRGRRRGCGTC